MTKREFIGLAVIFILSVIVRWYNLDQVLAFTYDQGRDMYVLQEISRGNLTLIGPTTGIPGVFIGPFYYYFLLPGFVMGGGSPFIVVKWILVWSVLTLPLFYLLLKPVVGKKWALIGYLLLALNPGAIQQAREIWNPSLVVPTLLVAVACLYFSLKKPWLLIVSYLVYGLSLQTELAYTFFLGPLFIWWGVWYSPLFKYKKNRLKNPQAGVYSWKILLLAIGAGALTLAPQVLFDFRNQFLISSSIVKEFSDPSKKATFAEVMKKRPWEMQAELKRTIAEEIPGSDLLVVSMVVMSVVMFYVYRSQPAALLWSGYFLLPLLGILFQRGNYGHFFNYYITPHYLPSWAVFVLTLHRLTLWIKPTLRVVATGALQLGILALGLSIFLAFVPLYNPQVFAFTIQHQIQALKFARQHQQSRSTAIDMLVPNLVPINYQYLSEWLAQSGQTTPLDFGAQDHQEIFLMHEPYSGDGSKVAFENWSRKWEALATCDMTQNFGIITVRRCQRVVTPSDQPAADQ